MPLYKVVTFGAQWARQLQLRLNYPFPEVAAVETLFQDIRFGLRMLAKTPAVTIVAVITLALGIGANAAIFSAVNGLLLRPLPVQNADRLMVIAGELKGTDHVSSFSYLDYRDFRDQTNSFSDVLAYSLNGVGMDVDGKPEFALVNYVSANFFSALGLKPAQGTLVYGRKAERPGTPPVVVLGYNYWKKRFATDPTVVGKQVKLNGRTASVIGVAPEGFRGLFSIIEAQAYLPLGMRTLWSPNDDFWKKRDDRQLNVLGFLKPGVNRREAQSSVDLVMQRLARNYPEDKDFSARIYPEWQARPEPDPSQGTLIASLAFMALAGLVLLLACTNVANIVLVRATGRTREMALRAALGAARRRIVRQLLTESILLGLLGGGAGLLLGIWVSRMLSSIRIVALGTPLVFDFGFDWRVFAFGMSAALLTGILVGLAPAWRASRTNLNEVLHEGSRGVLEGTGRSWMRRTLVMAQVAGSLMLLVVAGLFVRSLHNAESTYFGFDPSHLLNLTMDARNVGFDQPRALKFYRNLEDRIRALPGTESVSLASTVPMGYAFEGATVYVDGKTAAKKEAAPFILKNQVSKDYFATMRIPLLRGRAFNDLDTDKSPRVAIVNEAMAKRFWPSEDALGKTFRVNDAAGPLVQVVGLTKQGRYTSPTDDALSFFYVPDVQDPAMVRTLQVRTSGSPEALIPEVEREIHALAPDLPLVSVESMEQSLEGANGLFLFRMGTRFAGSLGFLGLALALVGVYGVMSYTAAQRTHEIGVRMALGASRVDILKMVLRQGAALVAAGVGFGLLLAFGFTRLLSGLLMGVSPIDPLTFAGVSVFLACVGLLASFIPARRAMNVEPLKALKYE
jgi:predicted permease